MRLKRLEIKGFKSFANDTVVHFNENVIGIVGPNGSGKSNIIDAFRWVLGEQKTTELRLDQMSSVLFNGTRKRKAANQASVAISFDNDKGLLPLEFQSITISRTLYRSGNSEYRINDVVCRLKDIHSLLIDTGIGSDTYAIIALGMVDDILSDKEQSRRKMLEQAAGITKYKIRKKETLYKLQQTREDLDRVEDLLYEIEANLKALEKQARRAQKYLEIKEEYRSASLLLASVQIEELKGRYRELEQQITAETDRYGTMEAALRKQEADLEQLKADNLKEEQYLSEQQRSLSRIIGELRRRENQRDMLLQSIQFAQNSLQEASGRTGQLDKKREELALRAAGIKERIAGEHQVEQSLLAALQQQEVLLEQEKSAYAALKSEVDAVVRQSLEVDQSIFGVEKKLAVNQNLKQKNQADIERERALFETRSQEKQALQAQIETAEALKQTLSAELTDLEDREQKRREDLDQRQSGLQIQQQSLHRERGELARQQNEYDLTRSLVDNLEGFPESIKFLSKQKEWLEHATLLSDVLYCEEGYRVAIENYLEPYLNYFIVPDTKAAAEAIQLLSTAQKGKAHFFLLSAFTEPPVIRPAPEGWVAATDLIRSESLYQPVIRALLNNVYVRDMALSDWSEITILDGAGTYLTQKGDLIRGARTLSGGSVGLFEGKRIGRRKNLEVLEKSIRERKQTLVGIEKEIEVIQKQIQQLRSEDRDKQIREKRAELMRCDQDFVRIKARFDQVGEALKQYEQLRDSVAAQIGALQQEAEQLQAELAALTARKDELRRLSQASDAAYQQRADQVQQMSAQFNQEKIRHIQQQNLIQTLDREAQYVQADLDSVAREYAGNEQRISDNRLKLDQATSELSVAEEDIRVFLESRKQEEASLSEREQQFFGIRSRMQQMETAIRETGRNLLQQQNLVNQLKEKFVDVKGSISGVAERLRIEFSIAINEWMKEERPSTVLGRAELESQVDRIRQRLGNFGEVNPMAIEAYNEIRERYDQIVTQREDILSAQHSLMDTMQEIEETARTKFLFAFEQIREHFVRVFRSLFTEEDFCDLILEQPDQPLESPIQIIARPKGKRPQTLHQLSGGEKTLTAIALLFSFYLLKPAPFCIFDEVDAPLDDANIEKFNRIIQNFSGDSQFIVVTHNKGTMAAVDMIYGVYMEEQGVSGLSAVDLRKFEHNGLFETVAS